LVHRRDLKRISVDQTHLSRSAKTPRQTSDGWIGRFCREVSRYSTDDRDFWPRTAGWCRRDWCGLRWL